MAPPGDTVDAVGSVTAPAAAAQIAQIATPGAGVYRVLVTVSMTGAAEPLVKNLQLAYGSTTEVLESAPGNDTFMFDRLTLGPNDSLTVTAVANGTAGAIYEVMIEATRIA